MDEGLPRSWEVLDPGTLVFASDGTEIGTVTKVLAVPEEDIFEGLLIDTAQGERFVLGEQVDRIYERGVNLKLDASACASLPEPEPAPAEMDVTPDDVSEGEFAYKSEIWIKRIWNRLSGKY